MEAPALILKVLFLVLEGVLDLLVFFYELLLSLELVLHRFSFLL